MSVGGPAGVVAEIERLFASRGSEAYFGEAVSMLEHSLQAAHVAQRAGAPPTVILAALLHDVGHLIEAVPDDIADWVHDAQHERVGSAWLARRFAREISEPVRLHVPAKRYLCATNPAYVARLSSASVRTLELQGGPYTPQQVAEFEREPFFREAVQVRWCDDEGKVAGLAVPGLASYRTLIEQAVLHA